MSTGLLRAIAIIAAVLALIRLDVLLLQAVLQCQRRPLRDAGSAALFAALLGQVLEANTEVEKRLDLVGDAVAVLARGGRLQLAVVGLVDDAVAAVLAANLGLLTVTIALVQLLGEELEELVRVLLLGSNKVLEGFVLGDPEAGEDVGSSVAISHVHTPEVLEHVVHGTAEAVLHLAGAT